MIKIKTKEEFDYFTRHIRWFGIISYFMKIEIAYYYPEKYKNLVEALSIRSRYKRINYIYRSACIAIDEYNKKNGIICGFINNHCMDERHRHRVNGCCCHCKYQTYSGCQTRNLACKLYFCEYMSEFNPLSFDDIPVLHLLSRRQRYIAINNVFCEEDMFIILLYLGSLIVYGLYCFKKDIDILILEINRRKNKEW